MGQTSKPRTLDARSVSEVNVAEQLTIRSDASFAGRDLRSQTGVVIVWAGSVILWRSSRQTSSALSTCEAEVSAAATGWQIVEGLKALLAEWSCKLRPPLLLVDNKSAVRVAELGGTWRTRYFAVRAARLAEESGKDNVEIRYCPTADMMADGLTKTAGANVLEKLRKLCDGEMPKIPDENQCFKKADPNSWWSNGLDANYLKASFARLRGKPVAALSAASASSSQPLIAAPSHAAIAIAIAPEENATETPEEKMIAAMREMMKSLLPSGASS